MRERLTQLKMHVRSLRRTPFRVAAGGVCLVLLAVWASPLAAAEVEGKLVLGAYKPPAEPPPPRPAFHWEAESGVKEVDRERMDARRELAVVLIGESGKGKGGETNIECSGGSLLPSTIVVSPGAAIRIRNNDEVAHELYATGMKGFDPEATSPRAVRVVRAEKVGSWPVRDKLLVHVRGHIHVVEGLVAVAEVKDDGTFSFAEVAPGQYTIKVFHGAFELTSTKVDLSDDKDVSLDPITLLAPSASK